MKTLHNFFLIEIFIYFFPNFKSPFQPISHTHKVSFLETNLDFCGGQLYNWYVILSNPTYPQPKKLIEGVLTLFSLKIFLDVHTLEYSFVSCSEIVNELNVVQMRNHSQPQKKILFCSLNWILLLSHRWQYILSLHSCNWSRKCSYLMQNSHHYFDTVWVCKDQQFKN